MKRYAVGVLVAVLGLIGVLAPTSHAAGVNDFIVQDFSGDYYLDVDAEGRSVLRVTERITARFSSSDVNHGIERAIPQQYDNHPVSLKIQSVKNADGEPWNYSESTRNNNMVLRIVDADEYVHGVQYFEINYTLRDVTKFFADTNSDEFYWDVNGTEWSVPFESVTARIHIPASMMGKLSGKTACYQGKGGSTDRCEIQQTIDEGGGIMIAARSAGPLLLRENITFAIGFAPQTFQPYAQSPLEKFIQWLFGVWIVFLVISSVVAVGLIIWFSVRWSAMSRRTKDQGTIVTEFLPPKQTSVLVAAQIADSAVAFTTAQLVDLAVRHYVKLYETQEKSLWKSAEYELEITKKIDDLLPEEQTLLKTLFGDKGTSVGSRLALKSLQNNYTVGRKLDANIAEVKQQVKTTYKLQHRVPAVSKWFKRAGIVTLIVSIVTVSPLLFIAAIVALVAGATIWPLTDKGLELRRHLLGLKTYIQVAEKDRIAMLQSPEGVEKIGATIDPENTKKMINLYEKVLPYAVLFGQEKQWNQQLGQYYESAGASPDWYSGNTAFNAAVFSSAMTSFNTATSYATATSSSSGGSSGGGSSGGGGGGGGGGGW